MAVARAHHNDDQHAAAIASRKTYHASLHQARFGDITTEIATVNKFCCAGKYHQQYLAKNPGGYCNHGFCQVAYA